MPSIFAQRAFQPPNKRHIYTNTEKSKIEASIAVDKSTKARSAKFYYWFDNKAIQITQGGYSGNLLHGPYAEYYYPENSLLQKGCFKKGLKHGIWNHWDVSGILKEKAEWKNGKLVRSRYLYDADGNLSKVEMYRNGALRSYQRIDHDTSVGKRVYIHPDTSSRKNVFVLAERWVKSTKNNMFKKRKNDKNRTK